MKSSDRISRRAFLGAVGVSAVGVGTALQLGPGASPRTVVEQSGSGIGLAPEAFGAVGDGRTDDAAAFSGLMAAAGARSLPIALKPGTTYALGARGWGGISLALAGPLSILGNGAKLKLLAMPSQGPAIGAGRSVFKIDATAAHHKVLIHDVSFDLGGLRAYAFDVYRAELDLRRNSFTNGDMSNQGSGDASICFFINASVGGTIEGNVCDEMGYFAYVGFTGAGYESRNLTISNNRGTRFYRSDATMRGDFVVGVIKDSVIHGNTVSGTWGCVALAGLASAGVVSSNVEVHHNHFSDFRAGGVSSDIYGVIYATGISIHDNIIRDAVGMGVPIYLLKTRSSAVTDNEIANTRLGIYWDDGSDVRIEGNRIDAGTARAPICGISITGAIGTTSDGIVTGNHVSGYDTNIGIGGAGHPVHRISLTANTTRGGNRGLWVQDSVTGIWADGNDFDGAHATRDIDNSATNGAAGARFGSNRFTTSSGI